MKEEFKLPYMVLCREDLKGDLTEEQINKISDEQMEEIAKKLSNALMQDWSLYLQLIIEDIELHNEVEE